MVRVFICKMGHSGSCQAGSICFREVEHSIDVLPTCSASADCPKIKLGQQCNVLVLLRSKIPYNENII